MNYINHKYDYGARMFAPALPLWNAMDPVCEDYYHISPYAYCLNNPVNNIDPDGKRGWVFATKLPEEKNPKSAKSLQVKKLINGRVQFIETA